MTLFEELKRRGLLPQQTEERLHSISDLTRLPTASMLDTLWLFAL